MVNIWPKGEYFLTDPEKVLFTITCSRFDKYGRDGRHVRQPCSVGVLRFAHCHLSGINGCRLYEWVLSKFRKKSWKFSAFAVIWLQRPRAPRSWCQPGFFFTDVQQNEGGSWDGEGAAVLGLEKRSLVRWSKVFGSADKEQFEGKTTNFFFHINIWEKWIKRESDDFDPLRLSTHLKMRQKNF